jgi:membrane-associated phospholipid phosphatase
VPNASVNSLTSIVLEAKERGARSIRIVWSAPDLRKVLTRDGFAMVLFLALAIPAFHHLGPTSIDRHLLGNYVPRAGSGTFRAANLLTLAGSPGVVIVLGVAAGMVAWLRFRSPVWGLALLAAPGIAGVVESTLKVLIGRSRPVTASLSGESGNGFPSGHAAGFCAFAFILVFGIAAKSQRAKSTGIAMVLVAAFASIVMALTRVLVGAHYPIDVLAGILVGLVCADIVALVARSLDQPAPPAPKSSLAKCLQH